MKEAAAVLHLPPATFPPAVLHASVSRAKNQLQTPEEMAAAGAATDWEAVAQQVQALQEIEFQKLRSESLKVQSEATAKFQKGVQRYLKAHAWGNATAADFLAAVSAEAGFDVAPAFSTYPWISKSTALGE